jgi:hypothetical protein
MTPIYAKETEIHDMKIDVTIDQRGNAHIEETWSMSVHEGTEVYKVLDNMDESVVSSLHVKDETGKVYETVKDWDIDWEFEEKANKCGIIQDDDRYEICLGIGKYGEKTYTFDYRVSDFVKQYDHNQGLNYAFFSEMSLSINKAEVRISSPYDFDDENSQIWAFGYEGKVYYDHGDVILKTSKPISEDGKMQLLMKISEPLFQNTFYQKGDFQEILDEALNQSEYNEDDYYQNGYYQAFPYESDIGAILIGIGLLFAGTIGIVIASLSYSLKRKQLSQYRFQDYHEFDQSMNYENSCIPLQGDLFQISYLAMQAGLITDNKMLFNAVLAQWVQKKWLTIEKETISFLVNVEQESENPIEKELYSLFMQASHQGVRLQEKAFEKWCQGHYDQMNQWYDSANQYIEELYKKDGLICEETVQGKWLWKTITTTRLIFASSLRNDMKDILGFKNYLENYYSSFTPQQLETHMPYIELFNIYEMMKDYIEDYYPNHLMLYSFHSIHHIHHHMVESDVSSSSFSGGGSSFSGGGGGGVR